MNWLDICIIVFVIAAIIRGLEVGFVRQFFSTFGFFVGLFTGAWLQGYILHIAEAPDTRAFLTLSVTLVCALGFMALGEYAGWLLKFKVSDSAFANRLDRFFGSVLAGVALLAAVWLGAAIFRNLPSPSWERWIRDSYVISNLDSRLPSAPRLLTKLGHLIDPNGFPQVFMGDEPAPRKDAPLPDIGELTAAVQAARTSVVKIEGRGCGGIVEGSGFVADDNDIITNAHVVAGVAEPFIVDTNDAHPARVVWFNKDLDIAVLRTGGKLAGAPLRLEGGTAPSSTPAAVMGYPGGGELNATSAAVLDAFTARGRDIYNQGSTMRSIYSLKGAIEEGNSGGPLLNKDGAVIGVIFAKSTTYQNIGYALTMDSVIRDLAAAQKTNSAVSTGSCTQ